MTTSPKFMRKARSMLSLHEFLNRARQLYNLDFHVLVGAGVLKVDDPRWGKFRSNPVEFILQCDDTTAQKLWGLCEQRDKR